MFLIFFESCFPTLHVTTKTRNNHWITTGIRVSCKKSLYILRKTSNSPKIKAYYTQYCKILRQIIGKAKQLYYSDLLTSTENKSRTSWGDIQSEIGKANNKSILHQSLN